MSRPPLHPQGGRRLLGDARREATAQLHIAASKRRRLANSTFTTTDEDDDDVGTDSVDTRALDDNDVAVFADAVYEDDDREADSIYAAVEERMQSRRKKQREQRLKHELAKYRSANPTLKRQFAGLKDGLQGVTVQQWAAIPDIGDYSVQKQTRDRYTPVPDSLLESARQESKYVASEQRATDLASIGAGRTSLLGQKLDSVAALTNRTEVDADAYLSSITGTAITSQSEIADFKRARQMLKSLRASNPQHAPAWLAAARLEETAGRASEARALILEGCRKCPKNADVWVEAARLHPRIAGKRILAQAVRNVPKEPSIWLKAAELEEERRLRQKVLRKGLEIVPESEDLWKAAVEMEEPTTARVLLGRAVEFVPASVSMWLALAKLQPFEEAQQTLQNARKKTLGKVDDRQLVQVWLASAQLEEVEHGKQCVDITRIIGEAVQKLSKTPGKLARSVWVEEAAKMDSLGFPGVISAIIRGVLMLNLKEDALKSTWVADATAMEKKSCNIVARSIYAALCDRLSSDDNLWVSYADLERRIGGEADAARVLAEGVRKCATSKMLWLMLAKHKWKAEGVTAAREVLRQAQERHRQSEDIALALAKLESENGDYEAARELFRTTLRDNASARVYMKAALLERGLRDRQAERTMLERGLDRFPKAHKLWLMLAQWYEAHAQLNGHSKDVIMTNATEKGSDISALGNAQNVYAKAVQNCETSPFLWAGYARWEESNTSRSKARAILETARLKCRGVENEDVVWREAAYVEARGGDMGAARSMVARGLQRCKDSGRLWALSVALEPKSGQKARSVDAVKKCGTSALVVVEVAKYIWRGGKIAKARTWFKRAVEMEEDCGDAWATWLRFEQLHGTKGVCEEIMRDCEKADPKHGDLWISVSKSFGNESLQCAEILRRVAEMVSKSSSVTGVYPRHA